MKKILFILSWLLSLIITVVYTYENTGKIDKIKNYLNRDAVPYVEAEQGEIQRRRDAPSSQPRVPQYTFFIKRATATE